MSGNQRWVEGRASYRPPAERIRPADYDVAEIPDDTTARRFVEAHHYSASYPVARVRAGLYRHGTLVGVAVYSQPVNNRTLSNVFPGLDPTRSAVELGRFVLLDQVPGNGETWFLARTFALLRARGIRGVVSFSDPAPRTDLCGRVTFPGHLGTIYQAHNGRYLGRSRPGTLLVLPDGTSLHRRTVTKIKSAAQGWQAGIRTLARYGAEPLAPDAPVEERAAWLACWLPALTRPTRHPGNHRYAWPLDRRTAVAGTQAPYPKAA